MKSTCACIRAVALAAALLTVIIAPRLGAAEALLIEPHVGVGKVKVGMTADEVVRVLGQPDRKTENGLDYAKLGFSVQQRQGVLVAVQCGHPGDKNHPYVKAFKGRTKEGIGMGSSRADVIKSFGQANKTVPSEGGFEALAYHDKWLTFGLTDGKVHSIKVGLQAPR